MTLDDNDRKSLIRYRIEEAEETIEDVRLLIENDRLRAAVNRIYYGMFYSLLALGLAHDFEASKHPQLIGWFNKNFIHGENIEPEYGKMINKAYNRRTKGDYDVYVDFDRDIVIEMFNEMNRAMTILLTHTRMIIISQHGETTNPVFWRAPSDRINQIMNR